MATQISCPKCGTLCTAGGYKPWQIIVAICFFPVGLLALMADKNPTKCPNCGYTW
jgi:DNA-directed RNA polymerase subunit RPC12/RpoP